MAFLFSAFRSGRNPVSIFARGAPETSPRQPRVFDPGFYPLVREFGVVKVGVSASYRKLWESALWYPSFFRHQSRSLAHAMGSDFWVVKKTLMARRGLGNNLLFDATHSISV
jgi:hypothetical protein